MNMTANEAMGILYSHSRINPQIGCEQRFISYHNGDVEKALDMAVKAIGENRWIPVSERLPELHDANYPYRKGTKRSEPVYITTRQDGENYFYPLPVRLYDNGYWYADKDSLEDSGINLDDYDDGTDTPFAVDIVAWKPMLEPYEEVSE